MENKQFTKLSSLIGQSFTINNVDGYKYKKWDTEQGKMLVSDTWIEGHRKVYRVETSKGILDLGAGQLGILLETVSENGKADLRKRTFNVKSNGKTGIDVRYFFNPVKEEVYTETIDTDEPINFDEIPF